MREPQPKAIQLAEYAPPAFRVETVDLDVDIREDHALVRARLEMKRNAPGALVLNGDELQLQSVAIDGKLLEKNEFEINAEKLTIQNVPDALVLESVTRI